MAKKVKKAVKRKNVNRIFPILTFQSPIFSGFFILGIHHLLFGLSIWKSSLLFKPGFIRVSKSVFLLFRHLAKLFSSKRPMFAVYL